MSPVIGQYDTYVTGINNDGYITGYSVPPGGFALGFIITPQGKRLNINPAGLGVNETKDRPVVENGQIEMRPINFLAISYDHRIIDGREAVLGLVAMKEALEDPARLLLDL